MKGRTKGGLAPRFKVLSQSSAETSLANSSTAPEGVRLLSNTCNTSAVEVRRLFLQRSRDERSLKTHYLEFKPDTSGLSAVTKEQEPVCLQPVSILIWTQVGLNPDGALDHLFAQL